MLDEEGAPDTVVFHCFSGDSAMARVCAEAGYYLSFAGPVTFKPNDELRAAAAICPVDRVLVETQRSLDHCERTYTFFAMGHMLLGPLPGEVGLREHLSSHLYLPVEPMDLDAVVQLPPAGAAWAANERANWLKVIGAGLRVEEKAL